MKTIILLLVISINLTLAAQIEVTKGYVEGNVITTGNIEVHFCDYNHKKKANLASIDIGIEVQVYEDEDIYLNILDKGKPKYFQSRQHLKNFLLEKGFLYIRTESYRLGDFWYSVMQFESSNKKS